MTQAEEHLSPEDMRKVFRELQLRMRNYALHHLGRINTRTLAVLQDLDLFDDPVKPIGAEVDLAVLRDVNHSRRVALPLGPLVVYATEAEPPKRMVVELRVLLYSELPQMRKTALACLQQMITDGALAITPKTLDVLGKTNAAIESEVAHESRAAAIAVSDALHDDVLVALQGVRQCLACNPVIQDSLNIFVPRVMHPAVSALDSIDLAVNNPEKEHSKLVEIIRSAVTDASNLADACAKYFKKLGFLPLAPSYGLNEVASQWNAMHPGTDAWTEIWGWAQAGLGPLASYHACSVFVLHPDLVPKGKLPELWHKILGVVYEVGGEGEDGDQEPWLLRRSLARHFAHHMEAYVGDNASANNLCFVWWFTEQVAALFPDVPDTAKFYRKNWVDPTAERSSEIWLAASPRVERSALRYATFGTASPWATGLLALMGETMEHLDPGGQSDETRKLFHEALISQMITSLPFPVESPANPTFSFECAMGETVLKWASHQSEEQRKALEQLIGTSRTLGSVEGLCNALRTLADHSLPDQVAICVTLKAMAYTDAAMAAGVWDLLSDGDWRQRALGVVDDRVLGLLIEPLILLEVENQDKWFSLLPHYLAELCEKADNDERRRALFLYVVHTSLVSDTVSAIRRLLRGNQKAKFVRLAQEYREHVEGMWAYYPPWVQGRLRGLLASLHVV